MIRAQAAIKRAAMLYFGLWLLGPVPRLKVIPGQKIIVCVAGNLRFLNAVLVTPLLVINVFTLADHLGRDQFVTGFTKRCGLLQKNVGCYFAVKLTGPRVWP